MSRLRRRIGTCRGSPAPLVSLDPRTLLLSPTHLELESRLDVLLERFRDGLVKVAQDLHGELRVDALIADEVVERVGQSEADATRQVSLAVAKQRIATWRRTCFDGTARRMIARP